MNIVTRGLTGLILALACVTQGCSAPLQTQAAPPPAPLTVSGALTVVELAPVLLAVRDHYPEAGPIRMGGVARLFGEQRTDVATNAETQALRVSVKHPEVRIIMTVAEGLYRIVARRSAGIGSIADLKGKRVATLKLTSSGYFLSRMLGTVGLSVDDVTIVEMNPLQKMVAAIDGKQVDAVVIWEPHSENALRALGGDAITFGGHGVYRELFNLNTTAAALADPAKRASIVRLVRGIIDATAEMKRDPAQAQALIAASGGFTQAEVKQAWQHHAFTAAFADDMLDVLVEEELWLARQENRSPRPRRELSRLIDRSVYREALRR